MDKLNRLENKLAEAEGQAFEIRWQQAEEVHRLVHEEGQSFQTIADSWIHAADDPRENPSYLKGDTYTASTARAYSGAWEKHGSKSMAEKPPWREAFTGHSYEERKTTRINAGIRKNPEEAIKIALESENLKPKDKANFVKNLILNDPDVFANKGVIEAVATATSATLKPRETPIEPRYTKTQGQRIIALGVQFAGELSQGIEDNALSAKESRELDEVIVSILDLLKKVEA